ncbi:MAG TPA: SIMPL domain-containing protein [Kofleriaceae bacterium]|nr:SIMPL domain-containing protein [Kofleriaceae bacterium]
MTKTLLASLALLAACHETKVIVPNAPAQEHGMTVTGTATLDISPDCADLTMTVTSEQPKPGLATQSAQLDEKNVIAALEKAGVAEKDLKLSTLQLYPVYTTGSVIRGYQAAITITATTRDFSQIATLMDVGANAGASQLSSQFRRSDMDALKQKVRDMAIAAAKAKAVQTAKDLGIPLGRVFSVSERPGGSMWGNAYFPQNTSARTGGIGGELQSLTLDVTIGYELTKET